MDKKITYIPTLQEYVKDRKKKHSNFSDCKICADCTFYRNEFELCIWGENIRKIANIKECPASTRVVKSRKNLYF